MLKRAFPDSTKIVDADEQFSEIEIEDDEEDDSPATYRSELAENVDLDTDMIGVSIDDPVRMYLREIGRVALISAEREIELSMAMDLATYVHDVRERLSLDGTYTPSSTEIRYEHLDRVPGGIPSGPFAVGRHRRRRTGIRNACA